jgi:hypothetical protein
MRKMIRTVATIVASAAVATLATVTLTGASATTAAPVSVATVATVSHPTRVAPTPAAQFGEDSLPPVMYLWERQGETGKRHGALRRVGTVDGHRGCWAAVPADPAREALLMCPDGYTQYS